VVHSESGLLPSESGAKPRHFYAGTGGMRQRKAGHRAERRWGAAPLLVRSTDTAAEERAREARPPFAIVKRCGQAPSNKQRKLDSKENRALAGPVQYAGVGAPTTPSRGEQLPASPIAYLGGWRQSTAQQHDWEYAILDPVTQREGEHVSHAIIAKC
jgi:hypothetical protein